jgi:hypothetical protein
MAFTFLLSLLTDEGMVACNLCFSQVDADNPDYSWEDAPATDFSNVYKVPILEAENKDLFDTDSDSGSSEDEDEIGGDEPDEKVLSDDEGAKPNLSDSEEEEGEKKTNRKMKKTKKTKKKAMTAAVPLKCSHQQAIEVIEEWLVFHAWYKLGPPPVVSSTSDEEIKILQTSIRKMLARLQVFYPRTKGHG